MKSMRRLRALGALGVALCVIAGHSLIGHASPGWSLVAGRMSAPHGLPAAVVLADGRVLVISGIRDGVLTTDVNVYDPATNSWGAPAAPVHTGRYFFASALLQDGRVLIAGGLNAAGLLASTEIYDPTLDSWTPGPDLASATFAPKAVTLGDGRVMMVGGLTIDGQSSSTTFYDPASGAWVAGPPMAFARLLPDATPLADGRILVSGGFTNDDVQSSVAAAELFDPLTNSWSPAGAASIGHTLSVAARLPDGRVLIAGGASSNANATVLASADIYDPASNSWQPAHPMSIGRVYFAGGLLADGSVMVAGGMDAEFALLQTAELYDAQQDVWTPTAQPLSTPRGAIAGAVVGDGGRFLVVGGIVNREPSEISDTGEVYTLNRPPVAIASADATEGVPGSLAAVTLSAAASSDPENDPLTFTWTEGTSTLARTVDPARAATVALAVGVHNMTLTVDDGFGGMSSATLTVTVRDATAPLKVLVAALAAENASLTAQNQQLQQQLAASQRAMTEAVNTIRANLRASFHDPSFTIPGGTPEARLQRLVRAVVELSNGCRLHLYKELGGRRHTGGHDDR